MYIINFQQPSNAYFPGIGNTRTSGLAELLQHLGFSVSGSERRKNAITKSLEAKGICVKYAELASHITSDIQFAVINPAISATNPEFQALLDAGIPYLTVAELTGQLLEQYATSIAVVGNRERSIPAAMISYVLSDAGMNPTYILDNALLSTGTGIHIGSNSYIVTEVAACKDSLAPINPTIGIIVDVEKGDGVADALRSFAERIPATGYVLINSDLEGYSSIVEGLSCKVITFSRENRQADYTSESLSFDAGRHPSFLVHADSKSIPIVLGCIGESNVLGALAAFAFADGLAVEDAQVVSSLQSFEGVSRRFEYRGNILGINIIDDCACNPADISATLGTAICYPHQTLWCIFQPYTYSEVKDHLHELAAALCLADKVILTDIYPAHETVNPGISAEDLQAEIQSLGHDCYSFSSFDDIEIFLLENCINGDLLITMGPGDVGNIGKNLLGE